MSAFSLSRLVVLGVFLTASAHAQEPLELRLRLEPGRGADQVVAIDQKISQTINKQRIDVETQMRFGLRFDVLETVENGDLKIKITYRSASFQSRMFSPGFYDEKKSYDSAKPPKTIPPEADAVAALVGQNLVYTVSPRGEVRSMTGALTIVNRILDRLKLTPAQRTELEGNFRKAIESQADQTIGLAIFPENAVGIGDSWDVQSSQSVFAPLLIASRYTLTSRQSGIATLAMSATLKTNPNARPQDIPNANLKYNLSGALSGVVRVDEKTGLTRDAEIRQRVSGRLSLAQKTSGPKTSGAKTAPKPAVQILSWPLYIKSVVRTWTIAPPDETALLPIVFPSPGASTPVADDAN